MSCALCGSCQKRLFPALRFNRSSFIRILFARAPGHEQNTWSRFHIRVIRQWCLNRFGNGFAGRLLGKDFLTYVITGDGEIEEGVVWEAAMSAKKYRASKLIVFIDNNGVQSSGPIEKVSGLYPIVPKWEAFGWHCQEIDGHSFAEILRAASNAKANTEQPSLILAHTIKGQGVPYMIGDNSWHKRVPTKEQFKEAMIALGGQYNE